MSYSIKRVLVLVALMLACNGVLPGVEAATPRGGEVPSTTTNRHPSHRRAMDNRDSRDNRKRRQYHNYPNRYSMEEEQQKKKKYYQRTHQAEASLGDVWLCYAFALGWSMWFLSSFLNTDLMRFAESDSILVHGNVREVSIEDDSLGTGIPTYHALIDYIITVRREAEQARIQVRKSFQTQHLLQQGFANVELLVLPEEPTSSVLKDDYHRELAAQEQAEEDIISIGGFDLGGSTRAGSGTVTGETEKDGRKPAVAPSLSRVDVWAKRASLILSGILVTASLIGAVQAVHRIPNEGVALLGWISVVVGSVLLWPLAMASLRVISCIQNVFTLPSEKTGIILKCDTNAQVGAVINEEKIYQQHYGREFNKGNISTRHLDRVNHPDTFEKLKNPIEKSGSKEDPNSDEASTGQNSALLQDHSLNTTEDESACYFVKLPGQKDASGNHIDDSSMSTISANSHMSKDNKRSSLAST